MCPGLPGVRAGLQRGVRLKSESGRRSSPSEGQLTGIFPTAMPATTHSAIRLAAKR
jgi:hypothetical protein